MAGKGDGRRKGANDNLYLKNNPFPSLLERRKEKERAESSVSRVDRGNDQQPELPGVQRA